MYFQRIQRFLIFTTLEQLNGDSPANCDLEIKKSDLEQRKNQRVNEKILSEKNCEKL